MVIRTELTAPGSANLKSKLRNKSRERRESLIMTQTAEAGLRRNGDPVIELQIEMVAIADLKPAGRRVRKTHPAQLAKVKASLLRFGMVAPVVIDAQGAIIHGHVVVEAARALDLGKIACVRLDHLSAEDARLLAITLNRLAETGDWDTDALAVEFRELVVLDEPLTITGFDEPVIDALIADDERDLDPAADRLPAMEDQAVSASGDVWA